MSQSPPALLVRLREADVVRLCGLEAAAQGIELAARHAIARARREQGRLSATVTQDGVSQLVWADFSGEMVRWGCDGHARAATAGAPDAPSDPSGGPIPALACAHVAALLSAWLRQPADFAAPAASVLPPGAAEAAPMRGEQAEAPHSTPTPSLAQVTQPRLLRPQGRQRGASTLADELARLPADQLAGLARRVLKADPPPLEHEARTQLAAALRSQAILAPLVARLDPVARALLADLALLGGAITAADLEAMAARAGRAPGALRSEIAVLARHGLVFAAPALATSDAEGDGGHAGRSWRAVAGWRIPAELRAVLPLALSIVPAVTRAEHGPPLLDLPPPPSATASSVPPAATTTTNIGAAVTRAARVLHATPRRLALVLALLPHAPAPYNPLLTSSSAASTSAHASATAPAPGGTHAMFPLVPGDLPLRTLLELARGLGVPPGLAQLARRVLLWSRDGTDDYPVLDLVRVPAEERLRTLRAAFRLWRAAEQPAELADLALPGAPVVAAFDTHHPALRPAALAAEALAARAFLLSLCAAAEPGAWYRLTDLLDLIWRVHPLFLRGRQSAHAVPAWWLRTPRDARPLHDSVHDEWLAAEGMFIRAFCEGPLVWWGLLDCAYTREGPLYAVRVTALGRYLLGLDEPPPADVAAALATADAPATATAPVLPTREGTLAVQPLVAGPALLDALDGWAHAATVAGGRLVYALSAEHACAAFDRGLSPEPLLAQLRGLDAQHGTRTVAALAPRLEAWRAEYGASRIERGWALLEARNEPALVEALAMLPALAARCRRLAPAVALIPQADVPALAAALAKRGYQL